VTVAEEALHQVAGVVRGRSSTESTLRATSYPASMASEPAPAADVAALKVAIEAAGYLADHLLDARIMATAHNSIRTVFRKR
jgi:uncharacterized protein (DUF1810 family)